MPIVSASTSSDPTLDLVAKAAAARDGAFQADQLIIKAYLTRLILEIQAGHARYLVGLLGDEKRRRKFEHQRQPVNYIRNGSGGTRRVLVTGRQLEWILGNVIEGADNIVWASDRRAYWAKRLKTVISEINASDLMVDMPKLQLEWDRSDKFAIAFILPERLGKKN